MFKQSEDVKKVMELARKKGVIATHDLTAMGINRALLSQLVKDECLIRIRHGLYHLVDKPLTEHQHLIEVCKQVPKGVIALLSALSFHQITTQNPFEIWVAVERRAWKPQIQHPTVRYLSRSGKRFHEGIETHAIDGIQVPVYSVAKTIADCFQYRNKIGLDVALEALKEAWQDDKFTLPELIRYAKIDRIQTVIQPYLETLI